MIVERLGLIDFRNYVEADVQLYPGANIFVGSNGQGKTNLVEAIAYLATLGSHRVASDAPLVRDGRDSAFVRARLAHGERRITLEAQINRKGSNKARIGGSPVKAGELPRHAHVVLFAPEDLQIVRGDPSARRRFVDQLLVQRSPRLSGVMADYDRVLRQRNALLKSARARGIRGDALATLDVWDDKLVGFGSEIIVGRAQLTDQLTEPLRAAYAAIAGDDHSPEAEWALSIDGGDPEEGDVVAQERRSDTATVAGAFRQTLADRRSRELDRGVTLVGPHRDDLILRVRGLPVRGYASHGESWSIALALRLATAALLRDDTPAGDPIVILDDVFAELDADRRVRLASLVAEYEQVIVTAAVEADVPAPLRARVVRVRDGHVVEEVSDAAS